MKPAFTLILLLCSFTALADIPLQDTLCLGTVCNNPAPAVTYISVSEMYGQVSASISGVPLSTGAYQVDVQGADSAGDPDPDGGKDFTLTGVRLLDPNGQLRYTATLTFHHWTTHTTSGRLRGQLVDHWELKSGSVQ